MATFKNHSYTGLRAVNLLGSGGIRFDGGGFAGTIVADLSEGLDRAWQFPNKSGTFPIMGTFSIQLPAIAATTSMQSTIATVAGIRAEDGLIVQLSGVNTGYTLEGSGSTSRILASAVPGNGNITLTFFNLGVATGYVDYRCSYVAVR